MGMLTTDSAALYAITPASIYRHHSYEPRRKIRRRKLEPWTATNAFNFEDEADDIFSGAASSAHSTSHSPSPQPTYSLRCSPQPPAHSPSSCSTASINQAGNHDFASLLLNDENLDLASSRGNLIADRYYNDAPPSAADDHKPVRQNQQQMRSFNIDTRGRITDCGFRSGRPSRPLTRSNKNRRATCPEIWLSSAEDEEYRPITRCVLRVFGASNTGKKTIAQQMAAHADVNAYKDVNLDYDDVNLPNSKTIGFMMNEDEVQLEIVQGSTPNPAGLMTICMVIYSVDSRESFVRAAQILYRLHDNRRLNPNVPIILVANKLDLQRKRKVTFIEGKMLAKIYKSAFVETSALLSMNVDQLWTETLKKLQKYKTSRERQLRITKDPKQSPNHLMGRIVKQGRRFAKSCEEIVRQIAAL